MCVGLDVVGLLLISQWRRQSWGTGARAPWSLRMHAHFAAVQTVAVLIFLPSSVSSKLDRQSHQLLWQAVAKNFSHIRFCRPNARWLSLLDDFLTTNFGTRAPRARAPPPGAKFWRRHSL